MLKRKLTDYLRQWRASKHQECLLVNPYITDVRQISVSFNESTLSIRCAVDTIYGEVTIDALGL